jgi:hypothetical protein
MSPDLKAAYCAVKTKNLSAASHLTNPADANNSLSDGIFSLRCMWCGNANFRVKGRHE